MLDDLRLAQLITLGAIALQRPVRLLLLILVQALLRGHEAGEDPVQRRHGVTLHRRQLFRYRRLAGQVDIYARFVAVEAFQQDVPGVLAQPNAVLPGDRFEFICSCVGDARCNYLHTHHSNVYAYTAQDGDGWDVETSLQRTTATGRMRV